MATVGAVVSGLETVTVSGAELVMLPAASRPSQQRVAGVRRRGRVPTYAVVERWCPRCRSGAIG